MAATITRPATVGENPSAPIYHDRIRIVAAATDTYPAGGIPVVKATNLPGRTVIDAWQVGKTTTGWVALYDRTNDTVRLYSVGGAGGSGLTELSTGANINNEAVELEFLSE